jgi:hypothetical protein
LAYSFQTFSVDQILTAAQMNQVEQNVRDHVHGRSSVLKSGISWPRTAKTATFNVTSSDAGELFDITSGTFSVTFDAAGTLGAGFAVTIRNSGTGVITLDPNGSETIDGVTTKALGQYEAITVWSDGTNLGTYAGGGKFELIASNTPSFSNVEF